MDAEILSVFMVGPCLGDEPWVIARRSRLFWASILRVGLHALNPPDAHASSAAVDFGFVKEYLTTTVAKTYNTEEKRTVGKGGEGKVWEGGAALHIGMCAGQSRRSNWAQRL